LVAEVKMKRMDCLDMSVVVQREDGLKANEATMLLYPPLMLDYEAISSAYNSPATSLSLPSALTHAPQSASTWRIHRRCPAFWMPIKMQPNMEYLVI